MRVTGASATPWKNAPSGVRPYVTAISVGWGTAVAGGSVGVGSVGSAVAGSPVGGGVWVGKFVGSATTAVIVAVGGAAVAVASTAGSTAVSEVQATSPNSKENRIDRLMSLIIPAKWAPRLTK